ncbi:MAG: alpha/beta fold hydrolase [Acidimicrobiales bacterium]
MRPAPPTPLGLVAGESPVAGLAVLEHRVARPRAVLVCVHGGLDRGGAFTRLTRRLDDVDVVAYDRRGYRSSRALAPVTFDAHVDDLVALARSESSRAPVALFGHSFGGVVALAAASREPELACLVVLYESPLPWILTRPSSRPVPTDDPDHEAELFFRRVVSNEAWSRLSEAERETRRLDGPALLVDLAVTRGPAPFDLASMATPVALIHGDGVLGPYYRTLAERLAVVCPSITTIELAHAGHGAHLSRPAPLAALISSLIEQRCASA